MEVAGSSLVICGCERYPMRTEMMGQWHRMTKDSLFIVIEGLDGSGKTTVAQQLQAALSQTHKNNVALTFEPHDPSAAGLYIRNALTKRIKASPLALALAFALNRADHNDHIIDPFLLSAGSRRILISDRYRLSSLVYQSTGGLSMEDIWHLNHWARQPDLTIFLNVSPHNCYARLRNRPQDKELFEKNLAARARKYQAGIELLRGKGETLLEVDANPDFPQVFNAVLNALREYGPDWLRIQRPLLLDEPAPAPADWLNDSSESLQSWVAALKADELADLAPAQVNRLFKAFVLAHGFEWGRRLDWSEAPAYELHYTLPLGIEQRGIALLLDSRQQSDQITKTIQILLDKTPDRRRLARLSDFIIVLDKGRLEPTARFDRDGSSSRISPQVQIITRQTLADWLDRR